MAGPRGAAVLQGGRISGNPHPSAGRLWRSHPADGPAAHAAARSSVFAADCLHRFGRAAACAGPVPPSGPDPLKHLKLTEGPTESVAIMAQRGAGLKTDRPLVWPDLSMAGPVDATGHRRHRPAGLAAFHSLAFARGMAGLDRPRLFRATVCRAVPALIVMDMPDRRRRPAPVSSSERRRPRGGGP